MMRKYLSILCAAAVVFGAASCQKADERKASATVGTPLKTITVRIAGGDPGSDSRLALDEETHYTKFQEGDQIFGWDASGNYTYYCTKADADEAEFELISEYAPSSEPGTKVNLVFANGYDADYIDNGALPLDIKSQNANGFSDLPIVMTGQGIVAEDGGCEVTFENETSYIRIKDCKTPVDGGMSFYSLEATNLYPQMTISIGSDGNFVKTIGQAGTIINSAEIVSTQDGEISSCMATFPTPEGTAAANIIFSAESAEGIDYYYSAGKKTVPANKIINITEKEFTSEAPVVGIVEIVETGEAFTDFSAAVAAANAYSGPCTLKLLQDFTVSKEQNIISSYGVTLDLNGKTLKYDGTKRIRVTAAEAKMIITDNSGDKTGAIVQIATGSGVISHEKGKLTISGGTLSNPDNTTVSTVTFYGGELVVDGGIITNSKKSTINMYNACNLTVKSGEVTSSGGSAIGISKGAILNVKGGVISNKHNDPTINVSDAATQVNIEGGTITASNRRALYVNAGEVNITGGTISATQSLASTYASAIYINGGTVTINGKGANLTQPNMPNDNPTTPIVYVYGGSLTLIDGTIGSSSNPTANGNFTAVRVAAGTFTMQGGYLYAKRHAIVFNGSGAVNISGGRLATTYTGWSLLRFEDNSTNSLTINGGGFTVSGSSGKMFAGKTTGAAVPSPERVTINPVCYFDKTPLVNGITASNVTGTLSQGSYTYDGKSYSFKVE